MEFREKLIFARATLNLSQSQLAEKLNVAFETINRWESGKFMPSKKMEMAFNIFCSKNHIIFEEDI